MTLQLDCHVKISGCTNFVTCNVLVEQVDSFLNILSQPNETISISRTNKWFYTYPLAELTCGFTQR